MKNHGPALTLVAVVSLALMLLGINVAAEPAPTAVPAVADAPDPPPATTPTPTPAEVVAEEPPSAFPAEATYTGRTSGNELTVAIAVRDGRAVAYVCDGEQIEVWLAGAVERATITLAGEEGTAVTGTLVDDAVFGVVDAAGTQWPFAATVAVTPVAGDDDVTESIGNRSAR